MRVYTLVKLDTKRNEKDLYTLAFVLALTPFRKLRRFTTASAFVCFNKKFHYEVLTRSERERKRERECNSHYIYRIQNFVLQNDNKIYQYLLVSH